jgi:hypothetical protein
MMTAELEVDHGPVVKKSCGPWMKSTSDRRVTPYFLFPAGPRLKKERPAGNKKVKEKTIVVRGR